MSMNEKARLHWAAMCVLALLAASCGSGADETTEASGSSEPTATVLPEATAEPTAAEPTQPPDPTAAPTAVPTEIPTATTTDCGVDCFSESERAAVENLFAVYNSGDWDAFTALMGEPEPDWDSDLGPIETMYIEADFGWSQVLEQTFTLDDCVEQDGSFVCEVLVEDAVHRALADHGLQPSRCRMDIVIEGDIVRIDYYNIGTCFLGYDSFFHSFGGWFEATYPEQETIQGFHYRAWNQFGEGAAQRAADRLDEWVATLDDGDTATGHDHGD